MGAYDKPEGVIGEGDWAVKRGEFSSGPLSEAQYRSMLDVWRIWPKYPKGYKGTAIHGHYLEVRWAALLPPLPGKRRFLPPALPALPARYRPPHAGLALHTLLLTPPYP